MHERIPQSEIVSSPSVARALLGTPIGPLVLQREGPALACIRWLEPGEAVSENGEEPMLREAVRQLAAYFDGRLRRFDLPLAPAGTAFQRAVWAVIADIRYGATLRYGELAALVGTSPRAAARACGANPLPIVVPCHRVVGAAGSLGGYSAPGGLGTKRRLLALEGVLA